jgi:spore maturation protein CgeB
MKIAFYASSLLSSYWNGAATYYRGILRALAQRGHDITFYEPDVYDRQNHRDLDPPTWCRVVVYPPSTAALEAVCAMAAEADVAVKASGVGFADDELLTAVTSAARPDALRLYWDVDAPQTLAQIEAGEAPVLRQVLPDLDMVLTYGGGPPVVAAYRRLGARSCTPIYNAFDPATHYPVPAEPHYAADLTFLGNRRPEREERVERFFLDAAARLPDRRFLLGGAGWEDKPCPPNVRKLGHVPTAAHNALNLSALAVLNISRDCMAKTGYSPATRVFEAAGVGACLMTDAWEGIEQFLTPGSEVLVVRDGADVARALSRLTWDDAASVGAAARARILSQHTYDRRAVTVERLLAGALAAKRAERAA